MRPRATRRPRTWPIRPDRAVTSATSTGKVAPALPNNASRSSQAAAPDTTVAPRTSAQTRGRAAATGPSAPSAATERATQCCTGNVTPAAAKPHQAHSTATGAASVAPRVRVTTAKKT